MNGKIPFDLAIHSGKLAQIHECTNVVENTFKEDIFKFPAFTQKTLKYF